MWRILISAIALALLLTACNSESNNNDSRDSETGRVSGTLVRADATSLAAYFLKTYRDAPPSRNEPVDSGLETAGAPAGSGSTGDKVSFSNTTLQEVGVDEADRIKTDGHYIYSLFSRTSSDASQVVDNGNSSGILPKPDAGNATVQGLRVMQANDNGLTEMKKLPLSETTNTFGGLYLANNNQSIVALASGGGYYWDEWFYPAYFRRQSTDILWIDVTAPTEAAVSRKLSFDGALISSRVVDNILYLVTRHYPDIVLPTDATIDSLRVTDFLPVYRIDDAAKGITVVPGDCFINEGVAQQHADVITLVAVDLASEASPRFNSLCYVGASEALYASQNALYLASTRWDYAINGAVASYRPEVTTDIHKFALDGLTLDYRGSAEVGGHLGWNQKRKSFRFGESPDGQYLRVVTQNEQRPWLLAERVSVDATSGDVNVAANGSTPADTKDTSPVMLTILKENPSAATLDIVSQLPNTARPAPIGKPGEQLYASRFLGDRAYLVTFRVTDPLYVLDLENPADPYIAGELKIAGYSDFLFNVGPNLLLGIGKDAVADSNNADGRGAWYQGVKLGLINVADPAHPFETDSPVIIGKRGTDSDALYDHHALTLRASGDDRTQIALPIRVHNETPSDYRGDPWQWFDYSHTGLYRYEIDQTNGKFSALPPMIVNTENTSYDYAHHDRSVLIGDNVHYLHNDRFWSQDWTGTTPIVGPQ